MNALVFQVLTVLAAAGGPATPENALLKELVEKGVKMPDGQVVRLPAPTMAEGLNAEQQAAVLAAIGHRGQDNVGGIPGQASNAPVSLKVGKIPSKTGDDVIRTVNL